jgi:hypothetical protein
VAQVRAMIERERSAPDPDFEISYRRSATGLAPTAKCDRRLRLAERVDVFEDPNRHAVQTESWPHEIHHHPGGMMLGPELPDALTEWGLRTPRA